WLLGHLAAAGTGDLAQALLDRDPGGQASLDDLGDVARLIAALDAAGDTGAARALAARAAADAPQASLADPGGAARLLHGPRPAGAKGGARALADPPPRPAGPPRPTARRRPPDRGPARRRGRRGSRNPGPACGGSRPVQRLPVRPPGPRGQLPLRLRAGPGA